MAGVLPARAQLGIASSPGRTVLYWPAAMTNAVLQSNTNAASTNWMTVSNTTPMTVLVVTNTSPAMFFHLVSVANTNSGATAAYNEITNNLVAWYPLAGDVNDHWGTDNATATVTPAWFEGVAGAANASLFLPGNQSLTANDNVLPMGTSPRTLSFWLYLITLPAPGSNASLFQYGNANGGQQMNAAIANVDGQLSVQIYISGNNVITFPFNAPLNQWFQLTVEINSGQTVYLSENGINLIDDSQTVSTLNTAAGGTFTMGYADSANYVYGALADFRVYDAFLSQAQLMTNFLAVYNQTTALPQLLYLKMRDDINTAPAYSYTNWPAALADASSRNSANVIYNDPTATDNTAWDSGPNGVANSAMHFHGVYPSYIDTHDATDFAFTNQSYSINFWVEPDTAAGAFLSCGIANQSGWAIGENGVYNASFNTYSNGTSSAIGGANLNVPNSSWNDICITVSNGTNVCAYLNGGLEYAGVVNMPLTSGTNTLWIGQQDLGNGNRNNLDGGIWLPQVWNTALSPNDVAKLYYEQMNGTPWP